MKKILFIVIIFLAVFLRLYNLGVGDLDTDEAKTALGIDYPQSFVLPGLAVFSQILFGVNEFSARLPLALSGIFFVTICYLFFKKFFGEEKGMLAMLLAAFLPSNIVFSRSAFLDVALIFNWLVIIYFWFKYEESASQKNLFFLFLALFVCPWLKIQTVYFLFVLFTYLLLTKKWLFWKDERFWLLPITFLPLCFYFASDPNKLYDLMTYNNKLIGKSNDFFLVAKMFWHSYGVLAAFALLGLIFSLRDFLKRNRDKENINIFFLLFSIILLVVLYFLPKQPYYYVWPDIVVIYCLIYFLSKISNELLKKSLIACFVIISLWTIYNQTCINKERCCAGSGCFWQTEFFNVEKQISKNSYDAFYLDTSLGFLAKWHISPETKKLDNFIWKRENNNLEDKFLLYLHPSTYESNPTFFSDYRIIKYPSLVVVYK
ncbi:MAG: Dolichyl-phosphate-mannose-protein mannosyltransferase [Parcubacteria group bacterium ADurb.Bin316]|nr:MAG: Dolichyl-phosphate-mannose-protein mannosyltransferase [Parcubacteria group bacterium ADurb.Bin316]HOZ56471.1 glycosyltransferase family 39 protein [bacterium]